VAFAFEESKPATVLVTHSFRHSFRILNDFDFNSGTEQVVALFCFRE